MLVEQGGFCMLDSHGAGLLRGRFCKLDAQGAGLLSSEGFVSSLLREQAR